MTIAYPDVSSYQGNMPLQPGTVAVCAKVSEGAGYANPFYGHFRSEANRVGAVFFAYHYLHPGDAAAQAQWCHALAGPGVNVMIDHEPTGGVAPSIGDAVVFTRQLRALGNPCTLIYLPHSVWQDEMGSPSLAELANNGLSLVSSDYTNYSDSGPGWAGYGGLDPVVWQWTDSLPYSGQPVDFNAYKGTVDGLRTLLGYAVPPVIHPVVQEEQDMITFAVAKGPNGEEPGIWALSGNAYWHIPDIQDQGALLAAGIKQVAVDFTFHEALLAATAKTPPPVPASGVQTGK